MTAFAYYRLPYLHHAHYVAQREGEPEVLSSVAELNGKEGFVIAPFSPSGDCPVLLIHPDESKLLPISDAKVISISDSTQAENASDREAYAEDFECFHQELEKGTFRKIVLARKATVRTADKDFESLFMKACRMYPRLFVSLVYTPQSGMWLMATPEILLKGEQGNMSTMSLARNRPALLPIIRWRAWNGRIRIRRSNSMSRIISKIASRLLLTIISSRDLIPRWQQTSIIFVRISVSVCGMKVGWEM